MTEIEVKIPSITGLANTAALNTVEIKIPDVNNLVKKIDYDTQISDMVFSIQSLYRIIINFTSEKS